MEGLLAILSLALVWIAGIAAIEQFFGTERRGFIHTLALGWLIGSLGVSLSLPILGFLLGGMGGLLGTSVGCVALILWKARAVRQAGGFSPRCYTPTLSGIVLAVFVAIQLVVVIWRCMGSSDIWDGAAIWHFKCRAIFLEGGTLSSGFFNDQARYSPHPCYPLYYPYLQYWICAWVGEMHQFWCKIVALPFAFVVWAVLYESARRMGATRNIGALFSASVFTIQGIMIGDPGIAQGYADLLCGTFFLAALVQLLRVAESTDEGLRSKEAWLAGLLAAGIPWAKQDGMILYVVYLLFGVVMCWPIRIPTTLRWAIPGALVLGVWETILFRLHVVRGDYLPLPAFGSHIDRIPWLATALWERLMNWQLWSVLWVLAPCALISLCMSGKRRLAVGLAVAMLIPVLAFTSVLVLSGWGDYTRHVRTSMTRLLVHPSLVALLAICMAAGHAFRHPSGSAPE